MTIYLGLGSFVLLIGLVAVETGDKGTAACPALVTVIYNTPKDSAAFEQYYSANHLPLVGKVQQEIGFTRADLVRFESALDGSAPAEYRQATLCFNSMDELKKGIATPGFKQVGDDLGNFATGGLTALIGEQPGELSAGGRRDRAARQNRVGVVPLIATTRFLAYRIVSGVSGEYYRTSQRAVFESV